MKYFVGIVPPDPIYKTLLQIQQAHGDNRLEPHITLRPPVEPPDANQWLQTISSVAGNFKPFRLALPGTGNFGKRVLFVSVCSDALSTLYNLLIPALKPFEPSEKAERQESYHPHLTLARSWCGFTPEDFSNMKVLADAYVVGADISFIVTSLRVYHKPHAHRGYQTLLDVPLQPWQADSVPNTSI